MTYDNFVKKYMNKEIDYDSVSGVQCVDLAKLYIDKVVGVKPQSIGDAYAYYDDFYNTYLNIMYQYGVPAGIIYGLLNGFTYLYGAYLLVKKKEEGNSLVFGVLMLGMVMMAQLTETMVHPAYTITMAIYLSIMTIMSVENKKK